MSQADSPNTMTPSRRALLAGISVAVAPAVGREARAADEPDILVEEPQSVASGRSIEQVGEGDDVWDSSAGRMARPLLRRSCDY
jgi:hypothetical protein